MRNIFLFVFPSLWRALVVCDRIRCLQTLDPLCWNTNEDQHQLVRQAVASLPHVAFPTLRIGCFSSFSSYKYVIIIANKQSPALPRSDFCGKTLTYLEGSRSKRFKVYQLLVFNFVETHLSSNKAIKASFCPCRQKKFLCLKFCSLKNFSQ